MASVHSARERRAETVGHALGIDPHDLAGLHRQADGVRTLRLHPVHADRRGAAP